VGRGALTTARRRASPSDRRANARARPTRCCIPARQLVGERVGDILEPDETASTSRARCIALRLRDPPGSQEPKATLSINAPVREKARSAGRTIDDVWRRIERSSAAFRGGWTSRPSISISPAVGSISRMSVRTSVDLPEPERPHDDEDLSRPDLEGKRRGLPRRSRAFARSSARGEGGVGRSDDLVPRFRPKIFQTPRARIQRLPRCGRSSCPKDPAFSATAATATTVLRPSGESKFKTGPTVRPSSSMSTLIAAGVEP